jgi:dipeptidyl aminopeptidase/acylaminoacyl peptidase
VGLAARGYVVGVSSYRGEDQSEGRVEVCLGEVTDVQNMMRVLRGQPYVEPTRFAAFGGSHGGCITLALALREPTLKAAVDFFGLSDLPTAYAFWQSELDQGEPPPCPADAGASCAAVHHVLMDTVKTATGGTPTQVPQEYSARSPATHLGSLTVPLMILQGTDDYLVDLNQTCEKRAALVSAGKPPAAWLYDSNLSTQNLANVCGGNFRTSPPVSGTPGAWSQDDFYLLVFEGQGHGFTGAASQYANAAAIDFLLERL